MQVPLQIVFRGLAQSDALETKIREKAAKLETFHNRIISCHIVIEHERRQRHQDNRFNVRIDLRVPGHEVAITQDHHDDVYVAVRDAFDAAKRVLEDDLRLQRREVKHHEVPQHGRIVRLNGNHGYIRTAANEEIYFSSENVTDPPFENLQVGTEVRFLLEPGNNTLLAKRVSAGKHRFGGG
jgi:ribosomal subunit interface protein